MKAWNFLWGRARRGGLADRSVGLVSVSSIGIALVCSSVLAAESKGDAKNGKALSAVCTACHGPAGLSPNPIWPNLAGQRQAYLAKQLQSFRDGERKDPLMSGMAKPLSDRDIEDLAEYFSSLPGGGPAKAGP